MPALYVRDDIATPLALCPDVHAHTMLALRHLAWCHADDGTILTMHDTGPKTAIMSLWCALSPALRSVRWTPTPRLRPCPAPVRSVATSRRCPAMSWAAAVAPPRGARPGCATRISAGQMRIAPTCPLSPRPAAQSRPPQAVLRCPAPPVARVSGSIGATAGAACRVAAVHRLAIVAVRFRINPRVSSRRGGAQTACRMGSASSIPAPARRRSRIRMIRPPLGIFCRGFRRSLCNTG